MARMIKCLPTVLKTWVRFLGWEDSLEKEMAIHSSTLAWKIPWTEESGRLVHGVSKESDTTEQLHLATKPQRPLVAHSRASTVIISLFAPFVSGRWPLLSLPWGKQETKACCQEPTHQQLPASRTTQTWGKQETKACCQEPTHQQLPASRTTQTCAESILHSLFLPASREGKLPFRSSLFPHSLPVLSLCLWDIALPIMTFCLVLSILSLV